MTSKEKCNIREAIIETQYDDVEKIFTELIETFYSEYKISENYSDLGKKWMLTES